MRSFHPGFRPDLIKSFEGEKIIDLLKTSLRC